MNLKILISTIFLNIQFSSSSRILFLFPTPVKSHMVIVHSVSTAMALRGHEVTVVSPFPLKKPIQNHLEIYSPLSKESVENMKKMADTKGLFGAIYTVFHSVVKIGIAATKIEEFQNLLNEKFDLIVIGFTFQNFLLGYGDHFKCPTAMISIQKHMYVTNNIVGNPIEPHSVASFHLENEGFDFYWRVKNFLLTCADMLLHVYTEYYQEIAYNELFPKAVYRSYTESVKNISLTLVNDHFSDGNVRPLVPGSIEIRGVQIDTEDAKPSDDLKKFLDDAFDGVILFSLGTVTKTTSLKKDTTRILIQTFARLKQRVVFKWDLELIDKVPENVFITDWIPQDAVLAHPNLKLFISHCGLGSMVESKFHGIPVLALPLFFDQITNANRLIKDGRALKLDINSLTVENFHAAITEMIHNETYFQVAKKLSLLYRDRPLSAKDTAVYWLEYIIRHHGAPFMQYPAIHLNIIQRNSLDVILFFIVLLWILKYFIVKFKKFTVGKLKKN